MKSLCCVSCIVHMDVYFPNISSRNTCLCCMALCIIAFKSAYIISLNLKQPACQWVSSGRTLDFHLYFIYLVILLLERYVN